MSSFLAGFKIAHHSGSYIHRNGRHRDSLRKHVRKVLHLPRHPLAGPVRRREPVKKPKPRVEIIDQPEENVIVSDDQVVPSRLLRRLLYPEPPP